MNNNARDLMRKRYIVVLLLFGTALSYAGCSDPHRPDGIDTASPEHNVTVDVIDEVALSEVLRRHLGKVVLVDYWATWCRSCCKLFPHTVDLHNRFADKGLAVISVSLDDPENAPAVQKFLVSNRASFQNFISIYGAGVQSVDAFAIEGGAVPYFTLYDRNGKLYQTFAGEKLLSDPNKIDRAIKKLLDL